jgi:modulator of FtsH protease HflK
MAWGDKGGWQGDQQGPWGRPPGGGGGQPPDEPPPPADFDDLIRRSQDQLRKLFPGRGSSGGKGLALAAVIVLVLWMASGIYFVKADEQGVVLRFGQYHRTTNPGVNYHLPMPIEKAFTPKVTAVNRVEVGYRSGNGRGNDNSIPEESLMLTGDENIVDITFEVQWKISNAPDYLFNVRDPEDTVKMVSESAMREVIGRTPIAAALAEGKLEIAQATKGLIQETLDHYKAGIEVVTVNLRAVDPPTQVIDAFRDVQTARADLETSRNQADAYRNDILPKTRGFAQQMILESEAYKQEVIARAQGEASRFLAVYNEFRQARDVTKRRMYLETMEEILQGMNKVIIEGKNTQGVLPYLPLPELRAKPAEEQAQ